MRATFAVVFLVAIVTPSSAGDVPTEAMLRAWVADLGAADFDVRERGEKNLLAAGPHAMAFVLPAVKSGDREVARRAEGIAKEAENNAAKVLEDLGGKVSRRNDGSVSHVTFHRSTESKVGDADLVQLLAPPTLEYLSLGYPSLEKSRTTDAGLVYIGRCVSLQFLDLENVKVTDAGLSHLAGLSSLKRLALVNVNVAGNGLAALKGLAKLESFMIQGSSVTDRGLNAGVVGLQTSPNLSVVVFRDTKITDVGVEQLATINSVESLVLDGTKINGTGLDAFRTHPKIGVLFVSNTGIKDEAIDRIAQLPGLTYVRLDGNQLSLEAIKRLNRMPKLRILSLGMIDIPLEMQPDLQRVFPNVQLRY